MKKLASAEEKVEACYFLSVPLGEEETFIKFNKNLVAQFDTKKFFLETIMTH
jgi:hypothetical protein